MLSMLMPKTLAVVIHQIRMKTQLMLFVPILNRAFVKRVKNVSTLTILLSTDLRPLICMLIKEPNWLWMPSVENKWTISLKTISIKCWDKKKGKWWKVHDQRSSVNISSRRQKNKSMVGNGTVLMVRPVNTSIAYHQDTCSERTKWARGRFKWIKFQFSKESMSKETNLWLRIKTAHWSLSKCSWNGNKKEDWGNKSKRTKRRKNCKRRKERAS